MRTVSVKPVPTPVEAAADMIRRQAGSDHRAQMAVVIGMVVAYATPDPHGGITTLTPEQRLDIIAHTLAGYELVREVTQR